MLKHNQAQDRGSERERSSSLVFLQGGSELLKTLEDAVFTGGVFAGELKPRDSLFNTGVLARSAESSDWGSMKLSRR